MNAVLVLRLVIYVSENQHVTNDDDDAAAAAAAGGGGDDDDDDDDVKSQLTNFDDAVFSLLRQGAAQRDFSPCVEVI